MRWILILAFAFSPHAIHAASPQTADQDSELSDEELRQVKTAERFLSILERNPRRGTALDRIYGHHVEFGTLDDFLASLKERAETAKSDGAAWMLVGLFEAQRGNDAAAAEAFEKAETLRPDDAMASYYRAQSQLRIGESEEAVASFERGIARKPPRADMLEIFQQLGRVHQRAQRTEEALKVWQRLEALFPDDPRVLEQIAVTLAEEGQPALALPRYQRLAELVRDDYRRVVFEVAAAELMIKSGQRDEGIASLESVLTDLNPDGWLYRDVRRRIENVYLRSGDQDSLVKYYQQWLEGHPEDVEGMTRLARFLASSARVPEATQWMEKALKLAPSRTDLRKAFIDQLVNDQRLSEAIEQYELLVKSAPSNTDFLRDWGKLVLRDKERPEQESKQEAIRIWNGILKTRPDDALTVSQVADLYRQNKMLPEAEELYAKAVKLAPADPQYREYLGEFLHIQKRPGEALNVWKGIAEGDRRTALNITRLAEVYNSFGFPEKAVIEIAEAVTLDPKDFSLQIRSAEYHSRAGKYDEALKYVAAADALATNDDERDAVIQQKVDVLQTSQQLDAEADRLATEIRGKTDATVQDWYLLARYMEASRRWPGATEAIDEALKLDAKAIPVLTLAARIAETSGDYGRAAETNRKLAEIDRRSRGDHLMNVSRLEAQLGRADEALQAAQDLILSAPGNTDNYEFYAQMCFRLGRAEDGLEALRKAVRINPNEPHLIMALAAALAEQLRTDEAIEVYWRAFEKTDEVEDKVSLTTKLAPLYQQVNRFDQLVERFERDRREEDQRREMTICLAQAWHSTGDLSAARQELESLLSEDTRDTNLLSQLAKLCQDGADLEAAIGYQKQLVAIAPGHETEYPLAGMLMANGQAEAAREIFVKLTQREEDPVRQIRSLDSLLTQGNYESVIGVVEPLLAQNRDDWELLYREAIAWASLEKTEEAINRFERILALKIPYDSLSRSSEAKLKQAQAKAKSDNLRGRATSVPQRQSPLAMRSMSSQVQRASGLVADNRYYSSGSAPPVWTPQAYGVARMAAFGWLMKFEEVADEADAEETGADATETAEVATESLVDRIREQAAADDASRNAIYDALYVAQLKNNYAAVFDIARRVAKDGSDEERTFFLTSLRLRHMDGSQEGRPTSVQAAANQKPLPEDDLELVRECYAVLNSDSKQADHSAIHGGNIVYASNGQAYIQVGGSYVQLQGFVGGAGFLTTLVEELRLAGQDEEAEKLLNDHLQSSKSANEFAAAIGLLQKEERFDEIPDYFQRWKAAALEQISEAPVQVSSGRSRRPTTANTSANVLPATVSTLQMWMGRLGTEEENAQLLSVLHDALDVSIAEARHRRLVAAAQTRRRSPATNSPSTTRISVYMGEKRTTINIQFPPANTYIDQATITLLRQTHELLQQNDVGSDLVDMLRADLKSASAPTTEDGAENDAVYRRLYLAAALWWIEEQDEAVELMAAVTDQLSNDLTLKFDMAAMYEARGDFEDALLLVDSISPRDQQTLQRRELIALQLSERLGDVERARSAAERLFGLRLNSETQLGLVDRMRRLGLSDMADAILARAERTATNQTSSLASLMMLYQGQGKTEQANQLAHMLLRRTTSPMSITTRSSRNPTRYRTQDSTLRTQALQLLQRSGALKSVIEQLETQLDRSPGSVRLLEQLIEFYGVTGQKNEAKKTLERALAARPDSAMVRLQMAKHFEQSGQHAEACDQYLELMKLQPSWVTDDMYQIERTFTSAKRKTDLVKALSSINLKSVRQPYYIVRTASNLLNDESTMDVGVDLLERAFEAFPSYRSNMIQNLRNPSVWKNDRVYQFAKKAVLPSKLDIQTQPWMGLNQISSYSGNGEVNVFFHEMLKGLKSTDKLADLEKSISELTDENPQWYSGRAMLALLELHSDRKDAARHRLQKLVEDEAAGKSMPAETCWIIGQELDRFEETRPMALALFEKAVSQPSQNSSMNQLEYSPVSKLINGYAKAGRKDEARDLLLKQLAASSFDNYDQAYASYQRLENRQWAAKKLQELEMPVAAMRLYRQILDDPESMAAAAQFNGRGTEDYYGKAARTGMSEAMTSVDASNASEVIAELLSTPETLKPGAPGIDLMLSTPTPQDFSESPMKSSYIELLVSLSKDDKIAAAIEQRLNELSKQHADDLSIAIALAAWKLKLKADDAQDAVQRLVVVASDHPLEAIPEGRRPNSRQRREAALSVPLWVVARECIGKDKLDDTGMVLAETALQAARRQMGNNEQSAILLEWGQALLNAGQKEEAETRWTELLQLATERPKRTNKKRVPGRKTGFIWPDPQPRNPDSNSLRRRGPRMGPKRVALGVSPGAELPNSTQSSERARADFHNMFGVTPQGLWEPRAPSPMAYVIGYVLRPHPGPIAKSLQTGLNVALRLAISMPQVRDSPIQRAGRPQPPAAAAPPAAGIVPPLTISQFRTVVAVAKAAAKNDMPELSRKAVREALKGGFPVADPVPISANSRSSQVIRSSSDSEADPMETEVITAFRDIVKLWQGDAYPADETYDVLKALVLPENRPKEIRLYTTATKLSDGKIDSLADPLVKNAAQAKRLDELISAVDQRSDTKTSKVAATALTVLIKIQQQQMDDAVPHLNSLSTELTNGANSDAVTIACMAALRAFQQEPLKAAAFPILQHTLQLELQKAQGSRNTQVNVSNRLADLVNQQLAASGDQQAVKDYFDSVLLSRQAHYSRYSGDYGMQMQLRDSATMAEQAAQLKMPALSLDLMGRVCDTNLKNRSPPSMTTALAVACRHVRTLPAAERYTLWREWTLPTEGRQSLRFLFETANHLDVPARFLTATDADQQATYDVRDNFTELVEAAKAAEKLSELRKDVQALADQKLLHADVLLTLTAIAQEDQEAGRALIDSLNQSYNERMKVDSEGPPKSAGDYLVYKAALRSPGFVQVFADDMAKFRRQLQSKSEHKLIHHLWADWAGRVDAPQVVADRSLQPSFRHWLAASSDAQTGDDRGWWTQYENQIVHLGGYDHDLLQFRYPLTGNFRFSVDCFYDSWAECDAGYGGIIVRSQNPGSNAVIMAAGGHENIKRPVGLKRDPSSFNRVTVDVKDGQMKYLLNNHFVYERAVGVTSPWLVLETIGGRVTSMRNLVIEGDPEIPRQVALLSGDNMDGWNTSTFSESQPRRALMAETPESENSAIAYYQRNEPEVFDWETSDGVLHGTAQPEQANQTRKQSWIYYHRPLQNGETLDYEFFYRPNFSVAHPSLGRLAFLLEPDGVETHWIAARGWDDVVNGVALDNAIVESECRRGPETLPLKAGDWNSVSVSLADDVATITLNGSVIFERSMDDSSSTRLGFFRRRDQAAKVRNVLLSGDWPEKLTDDVRSDLAAMTRPLSPPLLKDVATVLDDVMIAPLAGEVVMTSREMSPEDAFDFLADWVLPSDSHDNLRLYYSPSSPGTRSISDGDEDTVEERADPWNQFLSPAAELVRVAGTVSRLDEISNAVEELNVDNNVQKRNQQAMRALIALERQDAAAIQQTLSDVWKSTADLPKNIVVRDRSAEFVVAWRAAQDSAHWSAGADILRRLRDNERSGDRKSYDAEFNKHVHALYGDLQRSIRTVSIEEEPGQAPTSIKQWTAVPYLKSQTIALGNRPSTWLKAKGIFQHVPSETWSQLYFQSPLRGTFEIQATRSTHGYREVAIGWGMHSAEPQHDQSAARVSKIMHSSTNAGGALNLPAWDTLADFRIKVDGRKVTTFTNGVQIHEHTFQDPPDPWLVLQANRALDNTLIGNLRILGTPEIPTEIDLIDMDGWAAWRADTYGEWFSTKESEDAPWKRIKDELTAQPAAKQKAHVVRESLLRYQRPMLEDGVIEFETWYEPDAFELHPAIGSSAFLLTPNGVKRHRLTNAQYDTSGLPPGNQEAVPSSVDSVPLKNKDWNRVRLSLAGDRLTIRVNDVDVAEVEISDAANERQFGLFRFTPVAGRVRRLVYRGDWPNTLPPVAEQQLAAPVDGSRSLLPEGKLTVDADLTQPLEQLAELKLTGRGPKDRLQTGADGLQVMLHDSKDWQSWPGVAYKSPIKSDCELTVDYANLNIVPHKEGWGVGLVFEAVLDDPQQSRVECSVSLDGDKPVYKTQLLRLTPDGSHHSVDYQTFHGATTSGRLRLVRQGGQIFCFTAADGSDDFKILASFAVGEAAIKEVSCIAKCSDAVAKLTAVIPRFQIRQAPDAKLVAEQ
ncbi:DUF1583 domain-containing protein [Fuerstiella marisgermanici]|uniref:Tetratricopeptide repeat protein n=1 Tax=Fuerstiella marisgermanici TaxID=1891926 RepID=A0A1P8WPN7_9PLAN|nr:DUF1583 domain-containing protein [Fuerstiella marisgermanici]APZ96026.1 tetratricopeptide repeat protein [Fuerstiella marisgermanici]